MANTYTQLFIHGVFAVYSRQNLILAAHAEEIRMYMCGIITNLGSKPIAINTMPDHDGPTDLKKNSVSAMLSVA